MYINFHTHIGVHGHTHTHIHTEDTHSNSDWGLIESVDQPGRIDSFITLKIPNP